MVARPSSNVEESAKMEIRRRRGEIGKLVRFRGVWPKGFAGSSPAVGTVPDPVVLPDLPFAQQARHRWVRVQQLEEVDARVLPVAQDVELLARRLRWRHLHVAPSSQVRLQ